MQAYLDTCFLGTGSAVGLKIDPSGFGTIQGDGNNNFKIIATTGNNQVAGIVLQRGTPSDNYTDWKLFDSTGNLFFAQSSGGTQTTLYSFDLVGNFICGNNDSTIGNIGVKGTATIQGATTINNNVYITGNINASNSGGTANVYMGIGGEGAVIFENNAGGISISSNDGGVSLNSGTGVSLTVGSAHNYVSTYQMNVTGMNVSGNDTVGGKLTAGSFGGGDGTGLLSVGTLTSSVVSSAQVTTAMLTPAINTYSLTSNHTFDMSVQNAVIIITGTTGSWTVSFTNAVQGQVIWVINSTTTNFYIATYDGSHAVLGNTAEMVICDGSGKYFKIQ